VGSQDAVYLVVAKSTPAAGRRAVRPHVEWESLELRTAAQGGIWCVVRYSERRCTARVDLCTDT
jgi:hypothetical protein